MLVSNTIQINQKSVMCLIVQVHLQNWFFMNMVELHCTERLQKRNIYVVPYGPKGEFGFIFFFLTRTNFSLSKSLFVVVKLIFKFSIQLKLVTFHFSVLRWIVFK